MNTIKNYVDAMFVNLPQTTELRQLKNDILANMEDKYLDLRENNVSDNEAVGQVISEFGNIDEILEELGILSEEHTTVKEESMNVPTFDEADVLAITEAKRAVAFKVGLGVIFCAMGVALLLISFSLSMVVIGFFGLAIGVSIGVVLFILAGFQNTKYETLPKPFVLTESAHSMLEGKQQAFEKSFIVSITSGVVICVLSILPVIIIGFQAPNEDTLLLWAAAFLVVLASLGIFLFTYSGVIHGTYQELLTKGLVSQPTEAELKQVKLSQTIDSIFWPLVTILFFVWGFFLPGGFAVSWIVFMIGGIMSQLWERY
ncbi:hypothetical protein CBF34_06120 [Vagococcus penaei]|uniref:Uncharacterized protein n=1 Tax=Vagococcus penaei TaxID=633807 RepID=A0A1Q2D6W1_9ENTE|nr:permease prefix domain 1-containing protein [Vagococcus penaei]AQP54114.1 hypothetical protein BW732_07700 [Vagococcus penaei]RSU02112.1 hypothetical protein CBF34_06120 [Vagococcus penaei]